MPLRTKLIYALLSLLQFIERHKTTLIKLKDVPLRIMEHGQCFSRQPVLKALPARRGKSWP